MVDRDEPLTPERQVETLNGLYRQLISTLEEVLPLLGLVLFGDPKVARRFYRENFAVAMDRLADAWREVEARYGFESESPDISARAVMGIALVLALESHHNNRFDRDRAVGARQRGHRRRLLPQHRARPPHAADRRARTRRGHVDMNYGRSLRCARGRRPARSRRWTTS